MKLEPLTFGAWLLTRGLVSAVPGNEAMNRADLTIRTNTGVFTGLIDNKFPNTRQFRSIPYALPPTGPLRWMPPVAAPPSSKHHYSYSFPPPCSQYLSSQRALWNTNLTDFNIRLEGQSYLAGDFAQTTAEDCLKLAVWAPIHVKENAKLPVILFIPGGAFEIGGLNVPYQLPAGWVERTQQHIAIVANYRLDIMGFPNAAGLEDQNPGLLDQRRALEWVYDNIAAFGGDRDRITLWGQSAGAISVDMQLFAFPEEPLITGAFVQSGTAIGSTKPSDHEHRNFTFVAKKLGCDFPRDAAAELECMQTLPVVHILNFIGNYSGHAMQPPLSFRPTPDERTVWLNYTKRAAEGHMARVPAIVSTTTNEAAFFGYPSDLSVGPNQEVVHQATVASFLCPAVSLMNARAGLGLRTYRYQYGGNFSNVAPLPWLGAYHASDIPMFMGSYGLNGPATKFETRVAHAMQDFLYAFMVDPRNGLKHKGWPPHDGSVKQGGRIMRFGIDGEVDLVVDGRKVDKECVSRAQYNLEGGAVPPRQQGAQIPVTFTGEL